MYNPGPPGFLSQHRNAGRSDLIQQKISLRGAVKDQPDAKLFLQAQRCRDVVMPVRRHQERNLLFQDRHQCLQAEVSIGVFLGVSFREVPPVGLRLEEVFEAVALRPALKASIAFLFLMALFTYVVFSLNTPEHFFQTPPGFSH